MRRLDPDEPEPAMLACQIPDGTRQMTAYAHCSVHGMFRGQTVRVGAIQTTPGLQRGCSLAACDFTTEACNSTQYWKQFQLQNSTLADSEHMPRIILHGNGLASVTVGEHFANGSVVYHPMSGSNNSNETHWILAIWIEDGQGNILSGREFLPSEGSLPFHQFLVPSDDTILVPHVYCSLSGMDRNGYLDSFRVTERDLISAP